MPVLVREARVGQGLGVVIPDDFGGVPELVPLELGHDFECLGLAGLALPHVVDGLGCPVFDCLGLGHFSQHAVEEVGRAALVYSLREGLRCRADHVTREYARVASPRDLSHEGDSRRCFRRFRISFP